MKNRECKVRPEIISINNNDPMFYPFSVKINKCSGNCNNINDPHAIICVPDVTKDLNVKVFNLMSRTNKIRQIKWHESCKCICRLDEIICNNKQIWNKDKCRCKFKELIDKGVCEKGYTWNPSNCECKCNKSCNVGKYLDYSDYKCKKKIVDSLLIKECTKNIDETRLVRKISNENECRCSLCTVYRILFSVFYEFFVISTVTSIYFVYRKYMDCKKYSFPF